MKGPVRLAKKMARSAALKPGGGVHQKLHLFRCAAEDRFVCARIARAEQRQSRRAAFIGFRASVKHADFLNQMLYLDTKIFMTSAEP